MDIQDLSKVVINSAIKFYGLGPWGLYYKSKLVDESHQDL